MEQKLDLRSTLQELGINSIFTNDADLSGMTGMCAQKQVSEVFEPNPQQPDSEDACQSDKKSAERGRREGGAERLQSVPVSCGEVASVLSGVTKVTGTKWAVQGCHIIR